MARKQVANPLEGAQRAARTRAQPQDTFIAPRPPPRPVGGLQNLGAALSGLSKGLSVYAKYDEEIKEKQAEIDVDKGRAAYEAAQTKLGAAVKQGIIPAGASPAFRDGYARAQLRTMGADYAAFLEETLAENATLAESTEAYADWERKAFTSFAQENFAGKPITDAAILEEFMPKRYAARDKLQKDVIKKNIKRIEAERRFQVEDEISRTFDSGMQGAALGEALSQIGGDYFKTYPTAEQGKWVNGVISTHLITRAIQTRDPRILEAAQHIKTGTGKLSGTAAFRKARDAAQEEILDRAESDERMAHFRANKWRDAQKRKIGAELFNMDIDDPRHAELTAQLAQFDVSAASAAEKLRNSRSDRRANPTIDIATKGQFNFSILNALNKNQNDPLAALKAAAPYLQARQIDEDGLRLVQRATQAAINFSRSAAKDDPAVTATLNSEISAIQQSLIGTEGALTKLAGNANIVRQVETAQSQLRILFYEWAAEKRESFQSREDFRIEAAKWLQAQRIYMVEQIKPLAEAVETRAATADVSELQSNLSTLYPAGVPAYTPQELNTLVQNWSNDGVRKEVIDERGEEVARQIGAFVRILNRGQ